MSDKVKVVKNSKYDYQFYKIDNNNLLCSVKFEDFSDYKVIYNHNSEIDKDITIELFNKINSIYNTHLVECDIWFFLNKSLGIKTLNDLKFLDNEKLINIIIDLYTYLISKSDKDYDVTFQYLFKNFDAY